MAIAVLTAGAVGIMAMNQATTRGNMEAREMTTGTIVAQRWVERLRRDGLNWTQGPTTTGPLLLARTQHLNLVPPVGAPSNWVTPTAVPGGDLPAADFYGNDTGVPAEMHYCTNIRLEWILEGRAMRADVRVWWRRRNTGRDTMSAASGALTSCAPGVAPNSLTGNFLVRSVYLSTTLRYNPMPTP